MPFAEAEGLLSIALVRNHRLRATLFQRFAQFGAVIRFVGEELLGRLGRFDQRFGGWAVMRFTAG